MVPVSRRRLLQAGVGALVVVPGCNGIDRDDPEDEDDEILVIDGVESRTLRFDTTDLPVIESRDDDGRSHGRYVLEESDVDDLEVLEDPIADGEESGDRDDPLSFLREIDYDEATGVIVQREVSACYRQGLQYVQHRSDEDSGVSVQFCRTKRDPQVECSVDDRQVQVTLLEVPVTYDVHPGGFGTGSSHSCRLPPDHPAADQVEDGTGGDRE